MTEQPDSWRLMPCKTAGEVLRIHKRFPDDPDVLVSVFEHEGRFEVRTSAESRTSDPCDTVVGKFLTFEEARGVAESKCKEWDKYIEDFDHSFSLKDMRLIEDAASEGKT